MEKLLAVNRAKVEAASSPPLLTVKVEEASDQSDESSTPPLPPSENFSSSERRDLCLELERGVWSLESQEQAAFLLCLPCKAWVVGLPFLLPMQCKCIALRSTGVTLQDVRGQMSGLSASVFEQWMTSLTDREYTHDVVAAQTKN